MSKISRSVYQKVCEENKRLLNDLKTICFDGSDDDIWTTCEYYRVKFQKEKDFMSTMRIAAKKYIQEHKDELPDFLVNPDKYRKNL